MLTGVCEQDEAVITVAVEYHDEVLVHAALCALYYTHMSHFCSYLLLQTVQEGTTNLPARVVDHPLDESPVASTKLIV